MNTFELTYKDGGDVVYVDRTEAKTFDYAVRMFKKAHPRTEFLSVRRLF